MATAKKAGKAAPAKSKAGTSKARPAAGAGRSTAKTTAATGGVRGSAAPMKPIKETLGKTGLVTHLAESSGVDPKAVKAVMAALESTMVASIHKKGAGAFVLPGLLKVTAVAVPARKARKGINPFTKEETIFKAKPASVKLKVRPLKKLKDAAA